VSDQAPRDEAEPAGPGDGNPPDDARGSRVIHRQRIPEGSEHASGDGQTIRLPRRRKPEPLLPEMQLRELRPGSRPGTKFVRLERRRPTLKRKGETVLEATAEAERARSALGRTWQTCRAIVLGVPLATAQVVHERLNKKKALAIFSSDALSSSAYATEEILLILVLAGTSALYASVYIAIAIAALLTVVAISYRQTVRAYPNGGGAYAVAADNLGPLPSLVAASSLTVDYVLTVAVSTAAGVAAIISAAPDLADVRIELAVAFVIAVTVINLRGIRESGTIFAIPTYAFMFSFAAMIIVGLVRVILGEGPVETEAVEAEAATETLGLFLILRAFSAGSTALTGIEAVANGVPSFKPPESQNAATTLAWMAAILGSLFVGVTILANEFDVVPTEDITVVAQVAKGSFGETIPFYIVQATTALILILAANTSFNSFPRMASVLAEDGYMPRQFQFRGDRLAYSNGIIVLGAAAIGLLIIFSASVHDLIPLYAVGVFVGFTISQSGMIVHWLRNKQPGWKGSLAINAVGAAATGVVMVIIGSTKFVDGAWITIAAIALFVAIFYFIYRYYRTFEIDLSPAPDEVSPDKKLLSSQRVVVPVNKINRAVYWTLEYALSISDNVTAVHIEHEDELTGDRLQEQWAKQMGDIPLVIIESPYRSFVAPFLAYLDALGTDRPITVAIPQFVTKHWWENLLHNGTVNRLKRALRKRKYTVVVDVPWLLKSGGATPQPKPDPVVR
jgi:amino acid transporter